MKTLQLERLTRAAFAPFGDVIELDGARHFPINGGTTERYHDLAQVDVDGGRRPAADQSVSGAAARAADRDHDDGAASAGQSGFHSAYGAPVSGGGRAGGRVRSGADCGPSGATAGRA